MATKTVNEQITDSITQSGTQVLGSNPATAMGNLYTAIGSALSLMNHNAASAQQQAQITMQSATVQGINSLNSMGTAVLGRAAESVVDKDD
ncbi:RebB family R body protein [Celerinatantimonas sp. YJH-8]|uniref:RebB family R body protein n=1 Tax=Celerinatantimonas sp. YJH-8 TaxID=3228714 RepID=UPI0038CBD3DD